MGRGRRHEREEHLCYVEERRWPSVVRPSSIRFDEATTRYSPSSIVDDLLHNAANVSIALSVVVVTEPGRRLVVVGVGLEDSTGLPL